MGRDAAPHSGGEREETIVQLRSALVSRIGGLVLLTLCVPIVAPAQTPAPAPEPPPRVEVQAQATALITTGNSVNRTIGTGGELIWRPEPWVVKVKAAYAQAEDDDVLSARSTVGLGRGDRFLTVRTSIFGQFDYLRDLFAGIENRSTITGGLAYKLVDHPQHKLTVDGGLGYQHQDVLDADTDNSMIGTSGVGYRWEISKTSTLSEDFRYVQAFESIDNYKLDQSITLTASITSVLSLKIGNIIRFANEPVPGFETTDTITSMALVWSFKKPR
jgi:putative salt-induced outer membrane protein